MPRLSRDQVLAAADLRQEEVEVPEWGGSLLVRELSALGWKRYSAQVKRGEADEAAISEMALLVALCAVQDDGAPLFAADDVEALGRKSPKALRRAYSVALRLNTATEAEQKEAAGG